MRECLCLANTPQCLVCHNTYSRFRSHCEQSLDTLVYMNLYWVERVTRERAYGGKCGTRTYERRNRDDRNTLSQRMTVKEHVRRAHATR
jgi:hypothetical protein